MDKVSSGRLCTSSQLQAQVATLCREVTQLQRQRERSIEKESLRVKVVRSHPLPSGASLGLRAPPGSQGQAFVPGVEGAIASQAPALTPLRVPQDHPRRL